MENNIQTLLESPFPDERKQGVRLLVKSGDPNTLSILSNLIKGETDPDVRAYIRKAGVAVKKRTGESSALSNPVPETRVPVDYQQMDYEQQSSADYQQMYKQKNTADIKKVSLLRAIIDLVIYAVVAGALLMLVNTFLLNTLGDNLASISELAIAEQDLPYDETMQDFWNDYAELQELGVWYTINYVPYVVVSSLIFYIIYTGIIHIIARLLFKGRGTYAGMVHHSFAPMLVGLVTIYLFIAFIMFMMISYLEYSIITEDSSPYEAAFSLVMLFIPVYFIVFSIWLAFSVRKSNAFGFASGCGSIFIAYILWSVVGCGVGYQIIANAITYAIENAPTPLPIEGFILPFL